MIWERIVADGGDAAGEGHVRQTTAPLERTVADGSYAVGDRHARQTSAITERPVADGGDGKTVNCVRDDQITCWFRITTSDC